MGGRHAAIIAAEHPEQVQKVVIVDTAAEFPAARLAARHQQSAAAAPPQPETFDTFEEVVQNGIKQYPLTPEAELRHANYHNLYRGADGKWRIQHTGYTRTYEEVELRAKTGAKVVDSFWGEKELKWDPV